LTDGVVSGGLSVEATGSQVTTDRVVETDGDVESISERDLAVEAAEGELPAFLIDEELELTLPPGSRTVVVSDLHLPAVATTTSTSVADELADVLLGMTGPAAFVIIETIQWMAERGMHGLGLNFATMRAVVAGESGTGPWSSLERSVLHRFSKTLQIESFWRFNQKYDPMWNPRFAVTGAFLPLARSSVAIARAEAVTEIPVIGGLLKTREPSHHGGRG
jgi:hypothetical protein